MTGRQTDRQIDGQTVLLYLQYYIYVGGCMHARLFGAYIHMESLAHKNTYYYRVHNLSKSDENARTYTAYSWLESRRRRLAKNMLTSYYEPLFFSCLDWDNSLQGTEEKLSLSYRVFYFVPHIRVWDEEKVKNIPL